MEENKTKFDTIEDALVNLKRPGLSEDLNASIKNRVFSKLSQTPRKEEFGYFSTLIRAILNVASGLSLEPLKKVEIKESVFSIIESRSQKKFFWPRFFAFSSKAVTLVLVMAVGVGSFVFMNTETFIVRAAAFTAIDNFEGNVLVKRGDVLIPASKGLVLKQNDNLLTADNSFVVVKFFEDSVTRLSANTELRIEQLSSEDAGYGRSQVELVVDHGTVWTKVVNLPDAESSFVVKASDVSAKTQRGAFNLEFFEGDLNIGVFSNVVEVSNGAEVNNVMSGEKVLFDSDFGIIKKHEISEKEKNGEWVKKNLESDKVYLSEVERKLVTARLESIGVDSAEDLSFEKSLKENVALFLTFDDVDKKKLELDLAERNFVAAQLKLQQADLSDEDRAKSEEAIGNFNLKVKGFYDVVADVQTTDLAYATELKAYIDNKILAQKKDLSFTLPDSGAYVAREIVDDLELLTAKDDSEVLEIKQRQSTDKVAVLEDVMSKGDYELASNILIEYKDDMQGVLDIINSNSKATAKVKEKIANDIATDLKLLDAASNVATPEIEQVKGELVVIAQNAGIKPVDALVVVPPTSTIVVEPVIVNDVNAVAADVAQPADGVSAVTISTPAVSEVSEIIDGPFGVKIKGDKPLDPLLSP